MQLRRMALYIVGRTLASLVVAWFVLRKIETSTDLSFPFSLQEPFERALVFFALCAAVLLFFELAHFLMSRLQH